MVPGPLAAATVDPAGVVDLTFGLASLADPRWPAGAVLRYRVAVGRELALALEVENRGPTPIVFEEVLHTYLAVADVAQISLAGLEGAAYLDEADGFARKRQGPAPLVVRGETDRVYDETDAPCVGVGPGRAPPGGGRHGGLRNDRRVEPGRGARAARPRPRRVAEIRVRGVRERRRNAS